MKEKCDYCGQYGEGGAACGHCGAPIKPKENVAIAEMDIKKLSAAIAKEINRKPMFSIDSCTYDGLYQDTDEATQADVRRLIEIPYSLG